LFRMHFRILKRFVSPSPLSSIESEQLRRSR
jgi:hypothetical protein